MRDMQAPRRQQVSRGAVADVLVQRREEIADQKNGSGGADGRRTCAMPRSIARSETVRDLDGTTDAGLRGHAHERFGLSGARDCGAVTTSRVADEASGEASPASVLVAHRREHDGKAARVHLAQVVGEHGGACRIVRRIEQDPAVRAIRDEIEPASPFDLLRVPIESRRPATSSAACAQRFEQPDCDDGVPDLMSAAKREAIRR